jgi:hypothetical protein
MKVRVKKMETNYSENTTACILEIHKKKSKAVPLHAMEALGGRGGIAPTHT